MLLLRFVANIRLYDIYIYMYICIYIFIYTRGTHAQAHTKCWLVGWLVGRLIVVGGLVGCVGVSVGCGLVRWCDG